MKNCSLDAPVMSAAFHGAAGGNAVKTLTVPGRWTTETIYTDNTHATIAYVVVPKVSGARAYAVALTKPTPDVPGGVPFPSWRDFTPALLGVWQDREGAYWSELARSSGDATLRSRFHDMLVTVTVTL